MGNKKVTERNIRKLSKVGGDETYSVTIPKELIKKFDWREKQKVVVRKYKGANKLVIEDWEE